jgi:hypothetical protein
MEGIATPELTTIVLCEEYSLERCGILSLVGYEETF